MVADLSLFLTAKFEIITKAEFGLKYSVRVRHYFWSYDMIRSCRWEIIRIASEPYCCDSFSVTYFPSREWSSIALSVGVLYFI